MAWFRFRRERLLLIALAGAALGAAAGCRTAAPPAVPVPAEGAGIRGESSENLKATLWAQSAIEHRGVCLQAYDAATRRLEEALRDPEWTASPEQAANPGGAAAYRNLPPAVILDVDETVLDNSPYESRRILGGHPASTERLEAWMLEEAAPPIPGAVAFTRQARERGVAVLYLTNRVPRVEAATRKNLERLGFPVDSDPDPVVSRGDLDPSYGVDKGERRRRLAERYRILLLVGDDLGDFLSGVRGTLEERERVAAPFEGWWGRRFIVLPNPVYGSWEDVLLGEARGKAPDVRYRRHLDALDPAFSGGPSAK